MFLIRKVAGSYKLLNKIQLNYTLYRIKLQRIDCQKAMQAQLVQQNRRLREIMLRCEEQIQRLISIGQEHQQQLQNLLKFNQRLLSIIQNQIPSRTISKASSDSNMRTIQTGHTGTSNRREQGLMGQKQQQQRGGIGQRVEHLQRQQVEHLKEQESNYTHYNHYNHYNQYDQQHERKTTLNNSNLNIITNSSNGGLPTRIGVIEFRSQKQQPVQENQCISNSLNHNQQQEQYSILQQQFRVINAESYSPSSDEEGYQLIQQHQGEQQQTRKDKLQKQLQLVAQETNKIDDLNSPQHLNSKDEYNQQSDNNNIDYSKELKYPKTIDTPRTQQKGLNQYYRKQLLQSIENHLNITNNNNQPGGMLNINTHLSSNYNNNQPKKLSIIKSQASQSMAKRQQFDQSQSIHKVGQQQLGQQISSIRQLVNQYKEDFNTQQYSHLCNVIKDDLKSNLREIGQLNNDNVYEDKYEQCQRLRQQIGGFDVISHVMGIMRGLSVSGETERMVIDRVTGRRVNISTSNVSIMDKCR